MPSSTLIRNERGQCAAFPLPLKRGRVGVGVSTTDASREDPHPICFANRPPPCRAGLSHVQKHIDEETVVPGSPFELASQRGLCIGMSASDIEGKSPQNGKVGGSMVFSASRQILVENDVE